MKKSEEHCRRQGIEGYHNRESQRWRTASLGLQDAAHGTGGKKRGQTQ